MKVISLSFSFLFLSLLLSCAYVKCIDCDNGFKVADKNTPLNFDHLCAEPKFPELVGSWQYPAYFESQDSKFKVLVLAKVLIGWIQTGNQQNSYTVKGVGILLTKIRLEGLKSWEKDPISFTLEMKNSNSSLQGNVLSTYLDYSLHLLPKNYSFEILDNGNFIWDSAANLGDVGITLKTHFPTVIHEFDKSKTYTLNLILKNIKDKKTIILEGPVVQDLSVRLDSKDLKEPRFKVLGFWDTINPYQSGGLFSFFGAIRHKDCEKTLQTYLRELFKDRYESFHSRIN